MRNSTPTISIAILAVLLVGGLAMVPDASAKRKPAEIPLSDVPAPLPRPARPTDDKPADAAPALPDAADAPAPEPRPEPDKAEPDTSEPAKTDAKTTPPEPPKVAIPDRPAEMPADEKACRLHLTQLGVRFEERPQLRDASGCSVPWPIAVTALSETVKLAPEATLNCTTAETAARFTADVIGPAARLVLNRTIASLRQDSAYVCRPRNGTRKLSEHAFGNALDIGAIRFSDGSAVEIGDAKTRAEAEFLLSVRLKACGPFKTVLGPGSDADHARHFHFDLAPRRNGGLFCQ